MSEKVTYNGLTPPIGTSFFKMTEISLIDENDPPFSNTDLRTVWGVTLYKYAVNAIPTDPDFQAKNGRIYIIMVHKGSYERGAEWTGLPLYVTLDKGEDTVLLDHIAPGTNEGVVQEDETIKYAIDYTIQLPMFNNQGNDTFVFEAKYQDEYVLKVTQGGSAFPHEHEMIFAKDSDKNVGLTPINWLTVYQCLDPTKEVNFTFGNVGVSGTEQISEYYKTISIKVGEF
ncbi:hypothetical protein ONZ45_g14713 [Pleurotus djamor]|nr:hypothetical protein ONZ45_g14713 [Pleurotus djamor]